VTRGDGAREVGRVLDAFHEAAAHADAARYFGAFAPEGVFLGTDPGEKWTAAEFREWAWPYFQRESAWVFEPRSRQVWIDPDDGRFAWFDEVLDSGAYGECRGSGALRKIGSEWKIVHYQLSVPIPNDLLPEVVRRIQGGAPPPATTVLVVRHAEKEPTPADPDPPLDEAGRRRARILAETVANLGLDAIYATPYRRTQETVRPVAEAAGISPEVLEAGAIEDLVERIGERGPGATVLVCGHSNTIPAILAALGVAAPVALGDSDYDDLFLVVLGEGGAVRFVPLRYGVDAP